MDEHYISGLFNGIASIQSVKLIRDKLKGTPVGYGFVEFPNHEIAKNVFISLNGTTIPGTQRSFKLNWASHGTSKNNAGGPGGQPPTPGQGVTPGAPGASFGTGNSFSTASTEMGSFG